MFDRGYNVRPGFVVAGNGGDWELDLCSKTEVKTVWHTFVMNVIQCHKYIYIIHKPDAETEHNKNRFYV